MAIGPATRMLGTIFFPWVGAAEGDSAYPEVNSFSARTGMEQPFARQSGNAVLPK